MKPPRAGERVVVGRERARAVVVGETYGHLEVLAEALPKPGSTERRWRCRCLNVVDGRPCGNETLKRTSQLTRPVFKGCKRCTDEYQRKARNDWNKGGWW